MLHIKKNINKLCFIFAFVVYGCGGIAHTHANYYISVTANNYTIHNFHGPFFYDSKEILNDYLTGDSFESRTFENIMVSELSVIKTYRYDYAFFLIPPLLDLFNSPPDPYIIVDFDDARKCYLIISADEDDLIKQSTGDYNSVNVNTHVTKGAPAQYEFDITILNNPCK